MKILFPCSYESGILEDPSSEGPADLYLMTTDPIKAPSQPVKLEIEFKGGRFQT